MYLNIVHVLKILIFKKLHFIHTSIYPITASPCNYFVLPLTHFITNCNFSNFGMLALYGISIYSMYAAPLYLNLSIYCELSLYMY